MRTKRTLNVIALTVLLAVGVLLVVSGHFLHAYQVKRNAKGLLAQADQAEQEGQPAQVADYLAQYLALTPADTDALARYALLMDRLAKHPRERVRAFFMLERALQRDDSRQDVRRRAARLASELRLFRDARHHLVILLKEGGDDPELLQLQARCEAGDNKFDKAAEYYAKAVNLAPAGVELCLEYAGLLRIRLAKPEKADAVVERLVKVAPRSPEAQLAAARYYRQFGPLENAAKAVGVALDELRVRDAEAFLLAAAVAQAGGKEGPARARLEQGLQHHPGNSRLREGLARLEFRAGRPAEALRLVRARLKDLPAEARELWGLGNLLIDLDETGPLAEVIARLRAGRSTWAVGFLQGRMAMRKGEWGQARVLLERARSERRDWPEVTVQMNVLLAECYRRLGNPDQQRLASRLALKADPSSVPARRSLAAALTALGKTDQAIAEYRRVAERSPAASAELAQMEWAKALGRLREDGQGEEAERILKALPKDKQETLAVRLLWAEVRAAQGKLEEARRLAEAARDRDPKQVAPWLFLAGLAHRQGRTDQVLPLLEEAERRAGPRVDWQLARAGHWVRVGGAEGKRQLQRLAEGLPRLAEADRDRLLPALAGALVLVDDLPGARRLWQQLAQQKPGNLGVRLLLVEGAFRAGKEEEVRALLAEIVQAEGKGGPVAAYTQAALGLLRARQGDRSALPEAREQLARAASLRASWAQVPALEGELEELDGHKDRALAKYLAAIQGGEDRLLVFSRAVQLLYEQRRYSEADALLRKIAPQSLGELRRVAAQAALLSPGGEGERAAARQRALELARQAAPADSKDFRDHLWRGQVEAAAGRNEEAEKSLRQARNLAVTSADPWIALVLFLVRTDAKKAEAELASARTKLGKDALPLVLAVGYEALGQLAKAEEQYKALAVAQPRDPLTLRNVASFYARIGQWAKAEPLLRRIRTPEVKAPEATAAWARRILAFTLALGGSKRQFQEAQALVEENAGGGMSADDKGARALVLATRPGHQREAIRLFEDLSGHRASALPEVRYLLARLYEADGDWPKARAQLLVLLRDHGRNPVYLTQYVSGLLRHKQADLALEWIDRLVQVSPSAFETLELRARVLHANGQTDAAVKFLQDYARQKEARLDLAAALFDDLGRAADAEKLYRSHLANSGKPEDVLLLARHLGRHDRPEEALALCEKAWAKCPPQAVAQTAVAVVRTAKATAAQRRRVQDWLTAAIHEHPKTPLFPLLLATMHERSGRYAEAIELYRTTLGQAPRNVVALNNLAFLLAVKEGKAAEALNLIQSAINEAGPHPALLHTRAVVHLTGNRVDLALEDLKRAVAQAPSALRYFHLTRAQYLAKDQAAARAAYRKAVALGLQKADVHPLEQPYLRILLSELDLQSR